MTLTHALLCYLILLVAVPQHARIKVIGLSSVVVLITLTVFVWVKTLTS